MIPEPPAFPDLAPWPDAPPPAHHNQPPLEDQIVLDFEEALRRQDGLDLRALAVEEAARRFAADDIKDRDTAAKAGDLVIAARAVHERIEAERETFNRPLITAKSQLKAKADSYLVPMAESVEALRKRLDAYMAQTGAVVRGDYGSRVGTKTEWLFEIEDPAKLPLAIRRHPAVIEAMEKIVRGQVRGGSRKIAGVRIWSTQKANVR